MTYSEELAHRMLENHVSPYELAKRMHVPKYRVLQYLTGAQEPQSKTFVKIDKALNGVKKK